MAKLTTAPETVLVASTNGNGNGTRQRMMRRLRVRSPRPSTVLGAPLADPTVTSEAAVVETASRQLGLFVASNSRDDELSYKYLERVSWLYSAVRVLVKAIGSLPIVFRAGPSVRDALVFDGPGVELLEEPNEHQDGAEFVAGIVWYLLLNGGAFIYDPDRAGPDAPFTAPLNFLRPDRIRPVLTGDGKLALWEYRIDGKRYGLDPWVVFPILEFSPREPVLGRFSPILPIRQALELAVATGAWNQSFFERGATIDGIITAERLTDDERARLDADIEDNWQGVENAFSLLVMEGALDFKKLQPTHVEMGFERLVRMSREDICGALGVPPALVNDYSEADYAQVEMQLKTLWLHSAIPLALKIENAINRVIMRRTQRGVFWRLDRSGVKVLQEDENAKVTRETMQVAHGLRSRAELRAQDGLPTYQGAEEFLVNSSLVPATTAAEREAQAAAQRAQAEALASAALKAAGGRDPDEEGDDEAEPEEPPTSRRYRRAEQAALRRFEDRLAWAETAFAALWSKQTRAIARAIVGKVKANPPRVARAGGLPGEPDEYLPSLEVTVREATRAHGYLYESVLVRFGVDAAKQVNAALVFDEGAPAILRLVNRDRERVGQFIKDLLEEYRGVLEAGLNDGETVYDLAKRLREVVPPTRTERIARTEALAASNSGRFEGFRQTGVTLHEWVARIDSFTRDEHREMNGKVARLGDEFPNGLLYPGDPRGGPEQIINCRCTVLPVIDEGSNE